MYEKVKLKGNLFLYIKLNAPRYRFVTPKIINDLNKKLLHPMRIARKRQEYLKKQGDLRAVQSRNKPSR